MLEMAKIKDMKSDRHHEQKMNLFSELTKAQRRDANHHNAVIVNKSQFMLHPTDSKSEKIDFDKQSSIITGHSTKKSKDAMNIKDDLNPFDSIGDGKSML